MFCLGSFSDVKELRKTGIEQCKHVILYSWKIEGSNLLDSGLIQLERILQDSFPHVQYTMYLLFIKSFY
jgi:hypothetical protein